MTTIPSGSQITLTIGRNIRDIPMPTIDWESFKTGVSNEIRSLTHAKIFGPFLGRGEWDGIQEDSAVFIFITRKDISAKRVEAFLHNWAADYDQDAIAWSYGPNLLAKP